MSIDLWRILEQHTARIFCVDRTGRVSYLNRACAAAFGVELPSAAYGTKLSEHYEVRCAQKILRGVRKVIDSDKPITDWILAERWPNNRQSIAHTSIFKLHDNQGKPAGALAHLTDITRAWNRSEKFHAAVEAANDGLWYRHLPTGPVWFSRRWKAMLGYGPHEFPNDREKWLGLLHPEDRPRVEEAVRAHLAGESASYECEYRVKHKDGGYRWISARGRSTTISSGRIFAGSHSDITTRKNAELFYEQILDTTPSLIWVKGRDLRFSYANRAFAEAVSMTKHDVLGKSDQELVPHKDQASGFGRHDREVLRTRKPRRIAEEVFTDRDGVEHILATTKVPTTVARDGSRTEMSVLGVATDITEMRKAQNALEHERDLFGYLMDNVLDGVFFKDREGRFTRASRSLAKLVGVSTPDEMVGKTDRDFFGRKYAEDVIDEETRLFETGNAVRNVVRRTFTKTGAQWRLVSKVPVRNAAGRIELLVGVSRDITDLVETKELLEAVFDALPQSIWVKDERGVFLKSNRSFALRHGYAEPRDVEGRTDKDHWPAVRAKQYRAEDIQRIRLGRSEYHVRVIQLSRSGEAVELDVSKIVLNRPDGTPAQLLCVFDDVTSRVRAERKEIEKDISRKIGHCFKNWLELINKNTEELAETVPDVRRSEPYKRVMEGHRYLWHATQEAIYLRSLEGDVSRKRFSVSHAIAAVINVCNDRRIVVKGRDHIYCHGSKFHFENAVIELIVNAQREIPRRGGKIEVSFGVKRRRILVRVADNGPGIQAKIRGKEFELFTKGMVSRSGLGLAYVKQVCHAHGGDARRLPSPRGAVFEMELALE